MKKKLYATILSLCLLVAAFPVSVFAEETQQVFGDGSASVSLECEQEYTPSGDEFIVNIPTALSWTGARVDFDISLDDSFPIYDGFYVDVSIDSSCLSAGENGNADYIRMSSGSNYIGFTLMDADSNKNYTNSNPIVAHFTSDSSTHVKHLALSENITPSDPFGDTTYTGTMTFNIHGYWQ